MGSELTETHDRLLPYSGKVTRTQLLRGLALKQRWGNVYEGRARDRQGLYQSLNIESSHENTERHMPKLVKASTPCGGVFGRADKRLAMVARVTEFREARVKRELEKLEEELKAEKDREEKEARLER